MELMKTSLDKLYGKVYATPGRRIPEEVLHEIAIAVSYFDLTNNITAQQIDGIMSSLG